MSAENDFEKLMRNLIPPQPARRKRPGFAAMGPDYACLLCPCGGDTLHHGKVDVYWRVEDSALATQTTVVPAGALTMRTDGKGNPSSRRGGMTIAFWCEHCDQTNVLEISQHKGSTLVNWNLSLAKPGDSGNRGD
jgi:hypothetical protein